MKNVRPRPYLKTICNVNDALIMAKSDTIDFKLGKAHLSINIYTPAPVL